MSAQDECAHCGDAPHAGRCEPEETQEPTETKET